MGINANNAREHCFGLLLCSHETHLRFLELFGHDGHCTGKVASSACPPRVGVADHCSCVLDTGHCKLEILTPFLRCLSYIAHARYANAFENLHGATDPRDSDHACLMYLVVCGLQPSCGFVRVLHELPLRLAIAMLFLCCLICVEFFLACYEFGAELTADVLPAEFHIIKIFAERLERRLSPSLSLSRHASSARFPSPHCGVEQDSVASLLRHARHVQSGSSPQTLRQRR